MFNWKSHVKKARPHFVDTTPNVVYSGINTERSTASVVSDAVSFYGKGKSFIKRVVPKYGAAYYTSQAD